MSEKERVRKRERKRGRDIEKEGYHKKNRG